MTNFYAVLNRFINSVEFAEAIIDNTKTKASLKGSYFMVELLPDENWNVLFFRDANSSTMVPGVIRLAIPELSSQEFQELKEEVGTDNTQIMAEVLHNKDVINKKADILRRNLFKG